MTIQITTGNYFRTAAHVGIRQKVARRRPFDLPGGLLLWQAVGKVLLWSIPLVLSLNLVCSSVINSYRSENAIRKFEISIFFFINFSSNSRY